MSAVCIVRRLRPADAESYRSLRIEAIGTTPHTFAEELSAAMERGVGAYADALAVDAETRTYGAFRDGALIGFAASTRKRPPFEFIAKVSSVYVQAGHRRAGVAHALLEVIEVAARGQGVTKLTLAVAVQNAGARRLYEALGYEAYGIEPCAMRIDGMFVDEELRAKFLARPDPDAWISRAGIVEPEILSGAAL
jgi:ribosomal protein S18 acetylase RimI-like enzyme